VAKDASDATTALATAPAPIVIPDPTSDDDLLSEFGMEAHPRGGFHGLLEVIPTKADYILDLIRANSLWPLLSGLSCCAIEMMSTATPMNDMDRFGMFPMRASPRQADVLIVAGTLTTKMAGPLVRLWAQMPEPKWCVAMGTCTTSGGRFKRSYSVVQGVDRVMPVDVYVPGCPPRPEALLEALVLLQKKIQQDRGDRYSKDRVPQMAHARPTPAPGSTGAG
jgi:NADH-quinone oxidoreductase subunit B